MSIDNGVILNVIDEISNKAADNMQYKTFYLDEQGLRRCVVCKRRLETLITIPNLRIFDKKVNCVCDCGKNQRDAYRAEARRIQQMNEYKPNEVFDNPEYTEMTFAKDNASKSEAGILCRRWVAHYEQNKQKNAVKWLLLYGGKGKTFYAACITNYMMAKGYSVRMTSAEKIASELSMRDNIRVCHKYSDYELLTIEDISAVTDDMLDALYVIINNRKKDNKATIITSSMTTEESGNPKSRSMERIMQVVWDKGFPIQMEGKND